jgi:hypothetical protein
MPEKKEERKRNPESAGVASLTLGIISLVMFLFFPPIGILLSIIGLILGIKQQRKQKTRAGKIGMILNIIGLALNIAIWFISAFIIYPYLQQQLGTAALP